jgi:hypothetical protein
MRARLGILELTQTNKTSFKSKYGGKTAKDLSDEEKSSYWSDFRKTLTEE